MNKKQTLAMQRRSMHKLRISRLADGKCQECGNNPRGLNQDNTLSVRCDECKTKRATPVRRLGVVRPHKVDSDGDTIDYFDTEEFKVVCEVIYSAIPVTGEWITIGEILRLLCDNGGIFDRNDLNKRMQDALRALIANSVIEESWIIEPSRYRRISPREYRTRHWNGEKRGIEIASPSVKRPDDIPTTRRLTA